VACRATLPALSRRPVAAARRGGRRLCTGGLRFGDRFCPARPSTFPSGLAPLFCLHALPGGPCPSGANCCIVRQSRLHVYHRFDTFSFMCLALYIVFHVPSLASTVLPFALHVATAYHPLISFSISLHTFAAVALSVLLLVVCL
jgi:hypothetical protein